MDVFKKYDVSIHVLDINLKTGMADVEVCVRDESYVGICRATLQISARHLVDAVEQATEDLLDQHGPFRIDPDEKRDLYYLYFKDKVISSWSERSSAEAARIRLNRIWKTKLATTCCECEAEKHSREDTQAQ